MFVAPLFLCILNDSAIMIAIYVIMNSANTEMELQNMTTISLHMPVNELVATHPDIIPVMVGMGLDGVTNPALLNTVGRFMTLEKRRANETYSIRRINKTTGCGRF